LTRFSSSFDVLLVFVWAGAEHTIVARLPRLQPPSSGADSEAAAARATGLGLVSTAVYRAIAPSGPLLPQQQINNSDVWT
jgi:hypothetical protein